MGVSLFGGFTDEFVRVDELTGRVERPPALGATLLFPWGDRHFVVVENARGRPSQASISLRDVVEPEQPIVSVLAGELPSPASEEWGPVARLLPGLYPTAYRIGASSAAEVTAAENGTAEAAFVAGIFAAQPPVIAAGRLAGIEVDAAVGRDDRSWLANRDGLFVVTGRATTARSVPMPWRPHAIDYVPASDRVVVASWNRFRSQRGPSTDIYVFSARGEHIGRARVSALVDRMALHDHHVTTYDVTGNVDSAVVSGP